VLFNSLEFLIFFPAVFGLYWFGLGHDLRRQNFLLLGASYVFYGWWDWRFLSLIIASSVIDYHVARKLHAATDETTRKRLLAVSLATNLGLLGVFKYFNFFVGSFTAMLSAAGIATNTFTLNIILPVGISFYTFQTLSYAIDVYKRKLAPTTDWLQFFTFVAFFPQLVAGPIERATRLLPQFGKRRTFDFRYASSGAKLILFGFFKKVVVADGLATLVDRVYSAPHDYVGFPMLVATLFFSFQIYCDFSGYSDIAVGCARLLGFELMKNFDTPYFSCSLAEFWRRWHISLSTWFRDYLYIPLGGSRGSALRVAFNTLATFAVSGLWHGAKWTFVIWGAIHGCALIAERALGLTQQRPDASRMRLALQLGLTFLLVSFAWIFFRANSTGDALFIIRHIFSDVSEYTQPQLLAGKFRGMGLTLNDVGTSVAFLVVFLVIEIVDYRKSLQDMFRGRPMLKWGYYYLLVTLLLFWGTRNSAENFIYFQF
jgi:D-alanyl-lipoteichoic acid acyltransferase DltB (MBOAT superfamily)